MAILIANKLLETETEAWYTFYVDTLEDIKDLPTSKTTVLQGQKAGKAGEHCILHRNGGTVCP